jgi:hypothetical protein
MQIGVSTHPARRWTILVLVALLGLALTFATTSTSGASSGHAVAAKKKCKKKKKKVVAPPAPVTPPAPPPQTLRATLTWNNSSDLDLLVFDPSGNGGFRGEGIASINFPVDDVDGNGPEQLFDLQSPSTRQFSYCIQQLDDNPGTLATLQLVLANGSTQTVNTTNGDLDSQGDAVEVIPAGGYDPIDGIECGFTPEP